jgi:hypothetical protein
MIKLIAKMLRRAGHIAFRFGQKASLLANIIDPKDPASRTRQ